jgi:uncharacterized protein (DUF58 family)
MHFGTRGAFKCVQAARAAALLGWAASNVHDRVGALLFGEPGGGVAFFRPTRARQSFWRMLRALAATGETGVSAPGALPAALDLLVNLAPRGALVFVVADMAGDPAGLRAPLGRLAQRHEVVLLPVDDPADREIPDVGRVVFRTPDGARVEVDTADSRGQRAYREAWEVNRQTLQALARRLGLSLIPLTTHGDVQAVLTAGLRRRWRGRVVAA